MAKKKKKKEFPGPFLGAPPPFLPGVTPTQVVIRKEVIDLPLPSPTKPSKDYMPRWKAWFYYTGLTAGLPLGHETAGAVWGRAMARRLGTSSIIGGAFGYLGAITIVGTAATILDPLDYYEGGLAETRPYHYTRLWTEEAQRGMEFQLDIIDKLAVDDPLLEAGGSGAVGTHDKYSWLMGY